MTSLGSGRERVPVWDANLESGNPSHFRPLDAVVKKKTRGTRSCEHAYNTGISVCIRLMIRGRSTANVFSGL